MPEVDMALAEKHLHDIVRQAIQEQKKKIKIEALHVNIGEDGEGMGYVPGDDSQVRAGGGSDARGGDLRHHAARSHAGTGAAVCANAGTPMVSAITPTRAASSSPNPSLVGVAFNSILNRSYLTLPVKIINKKLHQNIRQRACVNRLLKRRIEFRDLTLQGHHRPDDQRQ